MTPLPAWLLPDHPYLLAISGGPDSIFLHHWLTHANFQNLTYIHLNHSLRGPESDADEAFLKNLLGPRLITQKIDVPALAQQEKLSLETAARQARHQFFLHCAAQTGHHEILLGHHADDQAETILFRLLRGSSGPKGMAPNQPLGPLTLLRPMLHLRRSEILAYLTQHKHPFRLDSSNAQPIATRNRLRNEALPLLTDILQRDPAPALIRAAQIHLEQEEALTQILTVLNLLDPQGRLFLPKIRILPVALQKLALHQFLQTHPIPDLSSAHLDQALTLIPPTGPPALNLPGNHHLHRRQSRLFITS